MGPSSSSSCSATAEAISVVDSSLSLSLSSSLSSRTVAAASANANADTDATAAASSSLPVSAPTSGVGSCRRDETAQMRRVLGRIRRQRRKRGRGGGGGGRYDRVGGRGGGSDLAYDEYDDDDDDDDDDEYENEYGDDCSHDESDGRGVDGGGGIDSGLAGDTNGHAVFIVDDGASGGRYLSSPPKPMSLSLSLSLSSASAKSRKLGADPSFFYPVSSSSPSSVRRGKKLVGDGCKNTSGSRFGGGGGGNDDDNFDDDYEGGFEVLEMATSFGMEENRWCQMMCPKPCRMCLRLCRKGTCFCANDEDEDLDDIARERPTNEMLLTTAFVSFMGFTILQSIVALIAKSEAMMGDSAAMAVDALTYAFNLAAERRKNRSESEPMLPHAPITPCGSYDNGVCDGGDDDGAGNGGVVVVVVENHDKDKERGGPKASMEATAAAAARTRRRHERSRKELRLKLELLPPLVSATALVCVVCIVLERSARVLMLDMHRAEEEQSDPNVAVMGAFSAMNLGLDFLNVFCFARARHAAGFVTVEDDDGGGGGGHGDGAGGCGPDDDNVGGVENDGDGEAGSIACASKGREDAVAAATAAKSSSSAPSSPARGKAKRRKRRTKRKSPVYAHLPSTTLGDDVDVNVDVNAVNGRTGREEDEMSSSCCSVSVGDNGDGGGGSMGISPASSFVEPSDSDRPDAQNSRPPASSNDAAAAADNGGSGGERDFFGNSAPPSPARSTGGGGGGSRREDGTVLRRRPSRERANLNMCSAYTHVFADTLRSVAVVVASVLAQLVDDITAEVADAMAAVVVCAIILLSLFPLVRGMYITWLEWRAIRKEEEAERACYPEDIISDASERVGPGRRRRRSHHHHHRREVVVEECTAPRKDVGVGFI